MELSNDNKPPYKISTITATGSIGCEIDLDNLYDNVEIMDANSKEGFVYIESGKKKCETFSKGFHKKQNKKKETQKRFDNQTTLLIKYYDVVMNDFFKVNCKVFKNGNIQMTGLKYINQGLKVLQFLIDNLPSNLLEKSKKDCAPINYRIRLINCDFRTGFEIRRDKLCKIIQASSNIYCSYEPCIYPGVKIKYNYNKIDTSKDGICKCKVSCSGKGCGDGIGQCKSVTIAVFQSGCIIITGGQSHEQIMDTYNYINTQLKMNMDKIIFDKNLNIKN